MKNLVRTSIAITCLSVVVLYLTGDVTQSLETDGKQMFCVLTWHVPLYGTVHMQGQAWWVFTQIWLFSLVIPAILWLAVGVRSLISGRRQISDRRAV
jgi:hypothetical protein